ncbi:MAG: VCBS repeat-containing protein, partial [Bacteroidaceae bacterium]|nr:VCBS repeat-containing protein [Bacteroidaceae bacterium]
MKKQNILALMFASSLAIGAQSTNLLLVDEGQTEVWVSPSGSDDDTATGNKEQPFATLERALQHVRQLRQQYSTAELGEVHIILRGGTYRLANTISIGTEDSGTKYSPTIIEAAEGETPILSGGVRVEGWQEAGAVEGLPEVAQGHVWKAETPMMNGSHVEFRQMWVNDVKMRRATTFDDLSMPQIVSVDKGAKTLTIPRPLMELNKAKHLEMYIIQDWAVNVMRVSNIRHQNEYNSILSFKSPEADIEFKRPWPILRADYGSHSNHRFYLSNAIELLNRPQEWYNDVDDNTLYYWPRYGETFEGIEAVVPHLETLIHIDGNLDKLTSEIHFRGITFEHTTWMHPTHNGFVPLQSGQYLYDAWSENTATANNVAWVGRPSAGVSVQNARNISFDGCHFRHMGSTGLDFVSGTRNVSVNGCIFTDIAGSGVSGGYFGDETFEVHQAYNPEDLRVICDSIYVTNNYIVEPANEDWGCHGVGIAYASNVNVLHNEIVDAPYSSISVGWGWIHTPNIMHDNHIDYNHINGFAVYMRDCGGIYTLSPQPNSTIKANVIEKPGDSEFCPLMWNMKSAQADIYADEGTDYYTVSDNWCRGDLSMNQNGGHNTWTNNNNNVSDDIRKNAGLEEAYKGLKDKVTKPTYAPIDSIGDKVNAERDQIDYIAQNEGFKLGNAIAVDLNNDNLRDIIYCGGESYQVHVGGVRMNTGNYGFAATQTLTHATFGNFAAGDLNGDGYIDLIQSGYDFWNAYNAVLMNDGKGKLVTQEVSRERSTSPACGITDINNDGLSDYFFIGSGSRNVFYTQRTSRDGFQKATKLQLPAGFSEPHLMYADFDNNQSVDLCLLSDKEGGVYTRMHYNDGYGNFTEKSIGIKEKGTRGGMAYADVNGDGWLDIVVGGELVNEDWSTTAANGGKIVSLYLNNGDGTFKLAQEFSEYMQDNVTQPLRFCDWNNDGYSDLILSGWNMTQGNIAQVDVFLNDGTGHFVKSDVDLPGVCEASLELADFTGEGRNDILISGNANGAMGFHGYNMDRRLAVLCKNHTEKANTVPLPPTELSAEVVGNSVVMKWNEGTDAETPVKSLSYNYYLRNLDTGLYLTYPNADIETGTRRVTAMGNAWLNLGWTLTNLPKGNYAWGVQTIDAGYAGSAFSTEQTFTITEELENNNELKSTKEKLLDKGWMKVENMANLDCANYYYALLDAQQDLTVVA